MTTGGMRSRRRERIHPGVLDGDDEPGVARALLYELREIHAVVMAVIEDLDGNRLDHEDLVLGEAIGGEVMANHLDWIGVVLVRRVVVIHLLLQESQSARPVRNRTKQQFALRRRRWRGPGAAAARGRGSSVRTGARSRLWRRRRLRRGG